MFEGLGLGLHVTWLKVQTVGLGRCGVEALWFSCLGVRFGACGAGKKANSSWASKTEACAQVHINIYR